METSTRREQALAADQAHRRRRTTRRQLVRQSAAAGGASAVVVALAGCAPGGEQAAGQSGGTLKGQIRFSHLGTKSHVDAFAGLAAQFQQQNPGVQVAAEPTWSWDNPKYIAEAVAGSASDIVWSSENYSTPLWVKGVSQELDPFMSKDKQWKPGEYFDTVLGAYKFRTKQVGLPILWGAYVMYYNKNLFQKAGRKLPDDTWTWETWLDTARALTRPASDPATMGEYGFETRNHPNVWAPWVWENGGEIYSADGTKCLLDRPEAVEGVQYWLDLMWRWKVAPTVTEIEERKLGTNAFGTGKVGMVWNAIYFLPSYRSSEGLANVEWDIAPIPKGKKGRITTNPTSGLVMWKGTKAPDAAWAFMRYLVSEEASKSYATGNVDGMPVHKAAAELILKDSRPPKSRQVYVDAFKYARPAYTTPYGQRADSILYESVWPKAFRAGEPFKPLITEAIPRINAAMQEEIAADTKK
jgi:multiple sugar transport system substrate-binding protein